MKKEYYIIIGLSILLLVGYFYYTSQLEKQQIKPLEDKKEVLIQLQSKSLDSALNLVKSFKDSLQIEKLKKPIIIPRYYETIIYVPVSDNAIINALSSEREKYIKKQSR